MHRVIATSISFLWNGSPKIGLYQGDPLSLYLFVLCMKRLGVMIMKEVYSSHWFPFQMPQGRLTMIRLNWLPQSICHFLDKSCKNFTRKGSGERGLHLVGWKHITKSKSRDGLGVRIARL
uniref:Reverse transcriptase domain-containing protein n=1 Tax=Cajanus cajan TaxID=3821 RepID=A0A151T858_CAJCA|nr:hypothetical protein KK1_017762 [Cajanus cajan]